METPSENAMRMHDEPASAIAGCVQRGKQLIALTPGHNPAECNLRSLRKYVGGWFKHNA